MSVNQLNSTRKSVIKDKNQGKQNVSTSKDKLEMDSKKNIENNLSKKITKKNSIKSTNPTKPMLATKSHQELGTSTSSTRSKLKKQISDPEKRGISSIYIPKKNINIQNESKKSTKKNDKITKESTNKHQRLPSRERKKSRTLSPSEIKVLHNKNNVNNFEKHESDYEYEDDFEDYESDFQECTDTEPSEVSDESVESDEFVEMKPIELKNKKTINKQIENIKDDQYEDHRLDSGHYELDEARKRAARIDMMSSNKINRMKNIEKPIFNDEKPSEIKSLPSSADEGFEDGRSGDFTKSSPLPITSEINLRDFSKKFIEKPDKKLSRGKKLLQMIKLDIVEWSIFESTPIAYEEFITIHGKINTRQIATQTNDDNLNIETQTDEIKLKNMWTQFPIVCRNNLINNQDINEFNKELIGVGSDDNEIQHKKPEYDILQLNEFLDISGKIMLALLEEKYSFKISPKANDNENQMIFSEATIKLAISTVTFLNGRPVTIIRYSDFSSKILLTIHAPSDEDIETSFDENFYMTDCCIGCQWNIYEPSRPTKLFYSASNITAFCVHPTNYNIVFGGLEDGSISLWDLEEDPAYHPKFIDKDNNVEWVLRSSTFSTIGNFVENEKFSKIISLKVISQIENDGNENFGKFIPIQICSLDEDGICTIWSVLRNLETGTTGVSQQLGQSWWGKIRLVESNKLFLSDNQENDVEKNNNCMSTFRDLSVDTIDSNNLYIATNTNKVLHATRTGKILKPSVYDGNFMDYSATTCIENCPFGQPYFLVGCTDGSLRLYSTKIEKPLLQLKNLNSTAPIKIIQWSRSKPFTIFVLDDQSNIHIWDLSRSDIFPLHSISPKKYGHIGSLQLSPCKNDYDMMNQYLALGLDNGTVEIHKINREFHYSKNSDKMSDLNTFLYYVAIY